MSERNWVLGWGIAIVILSSLPYLWGIAITPPDYHFLGLTHNIDDGAVYLSWMRQAADGHFFIRNLFTSEPQAARQFNVLTLKMGWAAAVTHVPLIWVFHLFRAVLGVVLIWSIWRFSRLFLESEAERRLLIPIVGLSAGIGWLFPNAKMPTGPVDLWQSEAITFLSIYLNPLFIAGLILMVWSFYFLTLAERTGSARFATYAGLLLLLLGNIHTYDVITVVCVWVSYLIALSIARRRIPWGTLKLSIIAAAIAVPSITYQFYVYAIDPVFRARANSPTPSPPIWSFFAGYGLILIGAIIGAVITITHNSKLITHNSLLVVWSVVGFAIPYIPVGQQRKLIMGLHIPLCMLCAYAVSVLLARASAGVRRLSIAAFIFVCGLSNAAFLIHDCSLLSSGETAPHYAPYMRSSELAAMQFLRNELGRDDTVLAPPTFALFTPAFTGHQVYYGHWSETPDYVDKIGQWTAFAESCAGGVPRMDILRATDASYLVHYATQDDCLVGSDRLRQRFSSGEVTVYRIISRPCKINDKKTARRG